jgi:hypothetical protein
MLTRKIVSSTLLLPGAPVALVGRQVDCATRLEVSAPLLGAKRHLMYGALTQPFISQYRVLMKFSFSDKVFRFLKLTIIAKICTHNLSCRLLFLFLFPAGSLNVFDLLDSSVPVNII